MSYGLSTTLSTRVEGATEILGGASLIAIAALAAATPGVPTSTHLAAVAVAAAGGAFASRGWRRLQRPSL